MEPEKNAAVDDDVNVLIVVEYDLSLILLDYLEVWQHSYEFLGTYTVLFQAVE